MNQHMAAGLLALAKPYLKEHAQILDPFCGVGTLLIERRFLVRHEMLMALTVSGRLLKKHG